MMISGITFANPTRYHRFFSARKCLRGRIIKSLKMIYLKYVTVLVASHMSVYKCIHMHTWTFMPSPA
jgi:hypothetical protein